MERGRSFVLTAAQFAAVIQMNVNAVYYYVREGKLKRFNHLRRIIIPVCEVERITAEVTKVCGIS
jgi:hypothetical protein